MTKSIRLRPILVAVAWTAWFSALAILLCGGARSALGAPPARNFTVALAGRSYDVHLPPGKGPFPVVLLLHGGGSNSKQIAYQSQMFANADRNHYAVVCPNGTGPIVKGVGVYTCNGGIGLDLSATSLNVVNGLGNRIRINMGGTLSHNVKYPGGGFMYNLAAGTEIWWNGELLSA